ncbi:MAG: glycoside hydrolase family 55 protein [Planctomycetaceae bacterium]|nr:glycoside hydrolase family 55 protein [Planctomycetaceae bacterium]
MLKQKFALVFVFVLSVSVMAAERSAFLNVLDFGAVGDGQTDNTAAFQKALDAAAKSDVQVVFAPRGNYRFDGSLVFPQGVTLKGVWESVPAHNGIRDHGLVKPTDDGTTLLVYGNAGAEDKEPFITLNTNCTLKGVCIYYPDQKTDDVPTAYPWAVAMRGKNPAVLDCELLNPYKGIDASKNERHLIRNISGQPIRLGVYVDSIYDIGRIENVHFNPWWSLQSKLFQWQMEHGEAFVFGRTDWQYVHNTFCFGYNVGYRFLQTEAGICNGNFLGIGADDCYTALVVDQCAPMALLITNGEFVSFHGPDPTMVRVSPTNHGVVRFSNCAFWGPCRQIAEIDGKGTVGFSDCTFVQWGFQPTKDWGTPVKWGNRTNDPALKLLGGTVLVRGCEFREDRPHIQLGKDVKKAIVSDNVFKGTVQIDNQSESKSISIQGNVGD